MLSSENRPRLYSIRTLVIPLSVRTDSVNKCLVSVLSRSKYVPVGWYFNFLVASLLSTAPQYQQELLSRSKTSARRLGELWRTNGFSCIARMKCHRGERFSPYQWIFNLSIYKEEMYDSLSLQDSMFVLNFHQVLL